MKFTGNSFLPLRKDDFGECTHTTITSIYHILESIIYVYMFCKSEVYNCVADSTRLSNEEGRFAELPRNICCFRRMILPQYNRAERGARVQ